MLIQEIIVEVTISTSQSKLYNHNKRKENTPLAATYHFLYNTIQDKLSDLQIVQNLYATQKICCNHKNLS
jgi:abortive infection bacteriophage resistance protein